MDRPDVIARLAEIRGEEMERARQIIGVRQEWLGFLDSGLPEGEPPPPLPEDCFAVQPLEVASRPLVELVRRERPHVILTYDEQGGYPHPDHVMTHKISIEAFEAAGDPERYSDAGEPWQPLKLYCHLTFHKQRVQAIHDAAVMLGLDSPYAEWLADRGDKTGGEDPHPTQNSFAHRVWGGGPAPPPPAAPGGPPRRRVFLPLGVGRGGWP